jgi:HTH-type transcriptional regulator/antitoxin HigA
LLRWLNRDWIFLAQTPAGPCTVSTVFLGFDQSFGVGMPLWFETAVLGSNDRCDVKQRYRTWSDAMAGHRTIVAELSESPPGTTIIDYCEELGIPLCELASRLGITELESINLLVGKSPITEDLATRLETLFGRPAHFWLNLERVYQARVSVEAASAIDDQDSLPDDILQAVAQLGHAAQDARAAVEEATAVIDRSWKLE